MLPPESLLAHVPLLIVKTNDKGIITEVNDLYCEFCGFERDELLGGTFEKMKCAVGIHESEFHELWSTITSGSAWHGYFCNISKRGHIVWIKATVVGDGAGGFCSMGIDVSAEKNAEYRLRRSQAFANIGTWDWNIRNGELWWSEQIGPMFGYARGALETSYANFLASVHPDDRAGLQAAVDACVDSGAEYCYEHRCVWPDGTERWMLEMGDVLRGEDGAPFRMLGVVCDIHERKMAEFAQQESEREARRANQAKSKFLGCMSHELRTPLNAILGFCELLLREVCGRDDDLEDPLLDIHRAAAHLLGVINNLLDMTSLEAADPRRRDSVEAVVFDEIAADCVALVRLAAERRGVHLRMRAAPGAVLAAHGTHLRQVLVNLLQNAVKYSHHGAPEQCVEVFCAQGPEGRLRVCVRDNGVGIAEADLGRIFEVFTRLPQPSNPSLPPSRGSSEYAEGVGIGLYVSKLLVQRMGGVLRASSVLGKGSTFWVELPCMQAPTFDEDVAEAGSDESASSLRTASTPGSLRVAGRSLSGGNFEHLRVSSSPLMAGGKAAAEGRAKNSPISRGIGEVVDDEVCEALERPMSLLYVEDNLLNKKLMQRFIGKHCPLWELVIASDGNEGLEILRRKKGGRAFDVVLLDLNLPGGLSGFELLRIMRTGNDMSRFSGPVIAISASRIEEHEDFSAQEYQNENFHFDDEILKPFVLSEVLTKIVRSLAKNKKK